MKGARVVIIGGVAGGMSAAARLARLDPGARITVLERSAHVSYANCGLPYYVGGVIEDESALSLAAPASLAKRFGLDVRVRHEVTAIDAVDHRVSVHELEGDTRYDLDYDYLVLSPGAAPVVPPIPGIERALVLRTVEDVQLMAAFVNERPRRAVVIGGGFIGLEIAENLTRRGLSTTVVEAADQLLAPLDPELASLVHDELTRHGVEVRLGSSVVAITSETVELASGESLEADLVVVAIGVRPDTALARGAGLVIGASGGITVDEFQRTSDPAIYAVGDAAEKIDALDGEAGLVPLANVANRHGRVTADHIAGLTVTPRTTIATAIVKVFDLSVAMCGWNEKRLAAGNRPYLAIHTHPQSHAGYYPGAQAMALKLLLDPTTGAILGAQGVGGDGVDKRIDVIATAMRANLRAVELADLELAYAPPFGSAKDPINMLGYVAQNRLGGSAAAQWSEVEDYRARGYELIDVRSAGEFARGTISGARNVPVDDLRQHLSEFAGARVLVFCQVGVRGHVASALLASVGADVANLDGGYTTWLASPAGRAPRTPSAALESTRR